MPRLKELKITGWREGDTFAGYAIVDASYLEPVKPEWIFSGPVPEGLLLTEEDEGDDCEYAEFGVVLHRKWSGPMSAEALVKLRSDFLLDESESEPNLGMLTEFGWLPGDRYMSTGDEWNVGGWTPIFDVSISIFDAAALTRGEV